MVRYDQLWLTMLDMGFPPHSVQLYYGIFTNNSKLLSGQLTLCRLGSVSEKEFDKGVTFHLVCSTS